MANIGQWNTLEIIRVIQHGLILDGGKHGDILMPNKYIYSGCGVGQTADVFVYTDTEDRLVATTERPIAVAGEFALLRCVSTNRMGAFMEIGLLKDLLVPFSEQNRKLEEGRSYIVRVSVDEQTDRLVGSCKLNRFLNDSSTSYAEDQEVDIIIAERTDLGYKVIVNHSDWGLIYHNEIFQDINIGQKMVGYVYFLRSDGRLDICLHKPAEEKVLDLTGHILEAIKDSGGKLFLTDKSKPEDIYDRFNVSKKTFKKALGSLYKARKVVISKDYIELVQETE